MSFCVSLLFRGWLRRTAFTDVRPKDPVTYCGDSQCAQFLCCIYPRGETGKALETKGQGWLSMLRAQEMPGLLTANN